MRMGRLSLPKSLASRTLARSSANSVVARCRQNAANFSSTLLFSDGDDCNLAEFMMQHEFQGNSFEK